MNGSFSPDRLSLSFSLSLCCVDMLLPSVSLEIGKAPKHDGQRGRTERDILDAGRSRLSGGQIHFRFWGRKLPVPRGVEG